MGGYMIALMPYPEGEAELAALGFERRVVYLKYCSVDARPLAKEVEDFVTYTVTNPDNLDRAALAEKARDLVEKIGKQKRAKEEAESAFFHMRRPPRQFVVTDSWWGEEIDG